MHMGELTGLLWSVNGGVNIPKYCEMAYSDLRQRAFPDSSGLVLHPGDVWEVPGYFYPSCSGAQGAGKRERLFYCSQRWSEPDFDELRWPPQNFHRGVDDIGIRSMGHLLNIACAGFQLLLAQGPGIFTPMLTVRAVSTMKS